MPIKGMTDRETLEPQLPRLGKLRKGAEKTGNKPGEDLDHFRFTSEDHPEVVEAFYDAYGPKPRLVNALLFFDTVERNFSTWVEAWDASGMIFRSDGENWIVWREDGEYQRGEKPHEDHPDQFEVGRLEFLVPELVQQGYVGTVTLETHSNHDIRNIAGVLAAAEQERGTLRGAQFVIRRVQEEISVPGWGDRKGKRSKAKKWLVKIEPPRQLFTAIMGPDEEPERIEGEVVEEQPWYKTGLWTEFRVKASEYYDVSPQEIEDALGDDIPDTMKEAKAILNSTFVAHWIKDDGNRRHWFGWLKEKGLTNKDAHKALEVEHTEEFRGSMKSAKEVVRAYLRRQEEEPDTDNELVERALEEELPW